VHHRLVDDDVFARAQDLLGEGVVSAVRRGHHEETVRGIGKHRFERAADGDAGIALRSIV
jgi:hypothetical protein